jgi:mannose-6-phosphate isomerase
MLHWSQKSSGSARLQFCGGTPCYREGVLLPLTNTPRDYAWGSMTAIAGLRGVAASGRPEAELWLGAHAASPALIHDGSPSPLNEWIASDPARALAGASTLPFLLKILAADRPLSLQAHPSREQARAGFARENAAGIPIDSPSRNYRDDEHKPELIVALSEEFVALSGFRALTQTLDALQSIVEVAGDCLRAKSFIEDVRSRAADGVPHALKWAVEFLLTGGPASDEIVSELTEAARIERSVAVAPEVTRTLRTLADEYPGDPGVVIGAFLNRVTLTRGEALFLPAGNVHAYLSGLGVELMSASDNVLRGGLTVKHVDVQELLSVADFEPLDDPRVTPRPVAPVLEVFSAPVDDFVLYRYFGDATTSSVSVPVNIAAIAVVTRGEATVIGRHGDLSLNQGEACFITGDEKAVQLSGDGEVFLATSQG